jgi:hypothetical protein
MKRITSIHAQESGVVIYYQDGEYRANVTIPAAAHSIEHAALRQAALDWYVATALPGEQLIGAIVLDIWRHAITVDPGDPEADPPIPATTRHVLIGTAPVSSPSGQRQLTRSSEDMPPELRDGFLALIAAREAALNA